MQHNVLILDFGSQYTQLIARRVRELNIFCEIFPYNHFPSDLSPYKAVILGGSPFSVRSEDAPHPDLSQIRGKLPMLAVCYGAQYLSHFSGGEVAASNTREYGRANLSYIKEDEIFFEGVSENSQVWMSHSDSIKALPTNGVKLASTHDVEFAAYKIEGETTYAIQYHPEVFHSTDGSKMLENFLVKIAEVPQNFTPNAFVEEMVAELKEKIQDDKVVLGLSGGVDSTVAAVLLHQAIGKNLYCIFVNNGLLRKNEFQNVLDQYKGMGLNVKGVDSSERFLSALDGIEEPEANLHPAFQSMLTELFLETWKEFGIQFIVETHSEYIVRKSQLLYINYALPDRKTPRMSIVHNPFAVYYFEKDGPYEMKYRNDGSFNKPFGEGFLDVVDDIALEIFLKNNKQ